ncbi:MAG: hypothetical protein AAGJ31_04150 [Verrucomicrobiota bacterium]
MTFFRHTFCLLLCFLYGFIGLRPSQAAPFAWDSHYEIETIPLPDYLDPQVGAMDLLPDGRLVVAFHRGEVMIYTPQASSWSTYATGLHEPLGLIAEGPTQIYVVQRAELTLLSDEDGDGRADLYETISDDWGLSGNYHEFAFGLERDSSGAFFIALGTASNGAGVRPEIRGPWNTTGGVMQKDFLNGNDPSPWKNRKKGIGRMYARVPYRGCIIRIPAGSRKAEVYATGFRTPNGLFLDDQDQLWTTDNQGDWVGASKLHRIEPGAFHGHPPSLLWADSPPEMSPKDMVPATLNDMRERSAALLPQGDCANSVTQPLAFPKAKAFGPLSGQVFVGEMNHPRFVAYLPDVVQGQHQGTAVHFLATEELGRGNNRMVFSPDGGTLYVGKTHLSWAGSEGIRRITYRGTPYFAVTGVTLGKKGFTLALNDSLSTLPAAEDIKVSVYSVSYHAEYGSKKIGEKEVPVTQVSGKGPSVRLELSEGPFEDRVYDIQLPDVEGKTKGALSSRRLFYTAHAAYQREEEERKLSEEAEPQDEE